MSSRRTSASNSTRRNNSRPYQTTTLPSGLRVLTVPLHDTKAVTVLVLCKVGSRFESKRENGVAHFVEHLMFKGTKRRPNTLAISKLLDGVGAEYNAFTSKDHTGYYVKINSEHLDLALDVVSDMLYHSKFDPKEIDRERQVIIEEINMYQDNPLMYIEDLFEQTMFAGNTLGQQIAGPRENIASVPRATILHFFQKHYFPQNTLVSVAGQFDEAAILGKVRRQFERKAQRHSQLKFRPFRPTAQAPRIALEHKETEQVQIGLGYPAVSYQDRRFSALLLLTTILGGNMSSRLFISIRERRGLAYSIHCSPSVYEDTGALYVQAGVARDRTEEAIRAILAELEKVAKDGVTATELHRGKEYLKGKLILDLEDSENLGGWYAKQWLMTKRLETPAERLARISAVRREDIRVLAKQLFKRSRLTLALIGPYREKARFRRLVG